MCQLTLIKVKPVRVGHSFTGLTVDDKYSWDFRKFSKDDFVVVFDPPYYALLEEVAVALIVFRLVETIQIGLDTCCCGRSKSVCSSGWTETTYIPRLRLEVLIAAIDTTDIHDRRSDSWLSGEALAGDSCAVGDPLLGCSAMHIKCSLGRDVSRLDG